MKIAVVHDYFTQLGGAEKVAEELIRMLPGAALHTTVALPDRMPPGLVNVPVKTSWMQKLPGMRKYYRLYFLLYPLALPSLDLSGYDLVLSSSSGYAKGVHTNRDALHVCYCHTPMRWAWSFDSYSAGEEMGAAKRLVLPHLDQCPPPVGRRRFAPARPFHCQFARSCRAHSAGLWAHCRSHSPSHRPGTLSPFARTGGLLHCFVASCFL